MFKRFTKNYLQFIFSLKLGIHQLKFFFPVFNEQKMLNLISIDHLNIRKNKYDLKNYSFKFFK